MNEKSFPLKLYRFLDEVEVCNMSHVASWQPHGRSFRIHNPEEFVALTASNPRWFVYRSYTSFQRQLNIYGFQRIANGFDKNGYYHKHFVRGEPELLHQIHRIPVKKNDPVRSLTTSPLPDFYATYNSSRTNRAIADQISSPHPSELASASTNSTESRNSAAVSQLVEGINNANQSMLQTLLAAGANSTPFEGRRLPVNQFTTMLNDSTSSNFLQPTVNPYVNQYVPGIHAVNSYSRDYQIHNNPISSTLGSSSMTILAQLQNLLSQSAVNNAANFRSNEPIFPSPTALLIEHIRNQIQAIVAQIQTGQTTPAQLQSLLNSVTASTLLPVQMSQPAPLMPLNSQPHLLLSSDTLNQREDLSLYQLHRRDNDQQQILRRMLQSDTGVGVPTTAAASVDHGRVITNGYRLSSDNSDNEIVPTGPIVNNLNPTSAPQQQNPATPNRNDDS